MLVELGGQVWGQTCASWRGWGWLGQAGHCQALGLCGLSTECWTEEDLLTCQVKPQRQSRVSLSAQMGTFCAGMLQMKAKKDWSGSKGCCPTHGPKSTSVSRRWVSLFLI